MATYPLKVCEKRMECNDTASLWLDVPQDLAGAFTYRPGQFLTVENDDGGDLISRQYSLSSSPGAHPRLRITVKKIEGGRMSTWLVDQAGEGDYLEVQTPRGRFFKDLDAPHHVLMLAAGSGIAPILSIGRWLLESNQGHTVTFVYGNRTPDTVILADEMAEIAERHAGICRIEHVMSRAGEDWTGAHGRIDRAYIEAHFASWQAASELPMVAYMCGPEGFMDSAEGALMSAGLSASAIHRESFDMVLEDDETEPGLEVVAEDDPGEDGPPATIVAVVGGEEYEADWQEGENILAALLRMDADVPFSCQEGTCSSCISKLTAGRIEVRPGVLQTLREDDLAEGLTLACLSRPLTRTIRIDFDEI
ncbi:ferredoxin--NADP reductase [Celeribacter indicus]|uniref:Electron transfer protein PaaE n=1 Tax=Celeribacter indicus TaxID=1208324 RepID=A0A0B5E8Q7_9RHOB|nr:ferredoxin--NADP reductase [Celeribacter indicus]AJE48682.1 electron transfer protein PaaE [Celeribacter indicus]SDX35655.1 ring-1,2-phenylacetyl-CoA epoxidase subunit PaaE [Celeribacter indicus]